MLLAGSILVASDGELKCIVAPMLAIAAIMDKPPAIYLEGMLIRMISTFSKSMFH